MAAMFMCSKCHRRPQCLHKYDEKHLRQCEICKCVDNETTTNKKHNADNSKDKHTQTNHPDAPNSMILLNEVLNVFQNKKNAESNLKTFRDSCINTEPIRKNLIQSKTVQYSIEENYSINGDGKFTVMNYQPDVYVSYIDLKKHKSSSIPQMKVEELKHSLKEKTISKDAIEEANRMFATIKKQRSDDNNRPLIRSGPRILPVVKTNTTSNEPVYELKCSDNLLNSGDSVRHCKDCAYLYCHYERYLKTGICEICQQNSRQSPHQHICCRE
ncbi:unnamed protein product [Leptidea sinapis]|uniref:Uncharacterized protein n=1 Tax=Leptidea sinapis TaxID=189913 RepID=A0A5E4R5Y6_9NEOP|nr:unnamed protein product [Leptidea sinapis]